jgi:hypothetical protein
VTFAIELNVGGKLIFGGSQGGWKPRNAGYYRITFYSPTATNLNLAFAEVKNYADFASAPAPEALDISVESEDEEEPVATPKVDAANNLSYVDVLAVAGGGGGGGKPKLPKSNSGKKVGHYK